MPLEADACMDQTSTETYPSQKKGMLQQLMEWRKRITQNNVLQDIHGKIINIC